MPPRRPPRQPSGPYPWGQPVVTPRTPGVLGPLQPAQPAQQPAHLPVFPAGYGPAGDIESLITGPLLYCAQLVVFRATLLGSQSIPGATGTVLAFDTILEDPFGGWSAAGTGTQAANSWQPPSDGTFAISVSVNNAAAALTNLVAGIGVSGAQFQPAGSTPVGGTISGGACGTLLKSLAGGSDYVQGYTWGTSAFSTALNNPARATSMEIMFVSE